MDFLHPSEISSKVLSQAVEWLERTKVQMVLNTVEDA
jgi:hypothetical protein